ncbi:hypothetical protein D9M69_512310 [compost metagenome]
MAVELEVGIGGRGPVGQHHVEPVQGEVGQQVVEVVFVAHQAQARLFERRGQQLAHGELGQAVGDADHEAHAALAGGVAHGGGQLFTELENLLGHLQRGVAGLGEGQAAPGGLEQRVAQRLLQQAHLGADGLHRHAQPVGGVGHAAFLGRDPEVIQVLVVQVLAHGSVFKE